MTIANEVLELFNKEISKELDNEGKEVMLVLDSDLFDVPGDDLHYVLVKYEQVFKVDLSNVKWSYYFPWQNIPRLKRWFGNVKQKDVEASRLPLTIRMFAESAEAGKWLFD
ncbi:cytoplasmic protein [Enterobacteriaceae bacterium CCUG 67584]|nr:cytoplasmic protein [Enterobacteriaceae bacterium CCUG 67584]